jgi:hypothetical protein
VDAISELDDIGAGKRLADGFGIRPDEAEAAIRLSGVPRRHPADAVGPARKTDFWHFARDGNLFLSSILLEAPLP